MKSFYDLNENLLCRYRSLADRRTMPYDATKGQGNGVQQLQ